MIWVPVRKLLDKQRCGGELCAEDSEDSDRDSSCELEPLIAVAGAYEEELRSRFKLPYHKVDIIRAISGTLRKW